MTGGARRWARHCHESFEREHTRESAATHADREATQGRAEEDEAKPESGADPGLEDKAE